MPSQTQTAGLMMNKKERSAHKGVRGREGRGGGLKKKRKVKQRETEREERETLFYPTRMDEVVLQVRPPRGADL